MVPRNVVVTNCSQSCVLAVVHLSTKRTLADHCLDIGVRVQQRRTSMRERLVDLDLGNVILPRQLLGGRR